ncbi:MULTISPECIES: hypothetical protein [unclassified Photobacterium]|uniref:hypothetical protein n=1 Tax=unclassified Photobacterium TaxID=2628852 RepID=UPI001EE11A57|nr:MULTISPECIES: hypothetical protein [unclassified Photobacterium]MCG3865643.1 hypothetical protein [Photobacterium sp. Ph6]MCG3877144.1 hypothetical protein [Photobacterium sp. Ph5]
MLKKLLTMSILSLVTSSSFAADYKLYDGNQGVKGFDPSMIEGRFKIVKGQNEADTHVFYNKSFVEIHKLNGDVYKKLQEEFKDDLNIRGFVEKMEGDLESDLYNDKIEKDFLNRIKGTNIKTVSEQNAMLLDKNLKKDDKYWEEKKKTFNTLLKSMRFVREEKENSKEVEKIVIPKDSIYIKSYSKFKLLERVSAGYKKNKLRENQLNLATKHIATTMANLAKKMKLDSVYEMDGILKIFTFPMVVDVVNKDTIILYPLTYKKTPIVLERVSMNDKNYQPISYYEWLEQTGIIE